MKQLIKRYRKLNPEESYHEISQVFGISKYKIIDYLGDKYNYDVYTSGGNIGLYDLETDNLIYVEKRNGYWERYEYDEDGNELWYKNSDGDARNKKMPINRFFSNFY